MATFHVREKTVWKNVDIDSATFSEKDLEGFISLQELTDYEIIDSRKKKPQKEIISTEKTSKVATEVASDNISKEKKKKAKERKKKVKGKQKKTDEEDGISKSESISIIDKNLQTKNKKNQNRKEKQKKKAQDRVLVKGNQQAVEDINELMEAESTEMNSKNKKSLPNKRKNTSKGSETNSPAKKAKLDKPTEQHTIKTEVEDEKVVEKSLKGMAAWKDLFVPEEVLWALKGQGFVEPTPIQRQILPSAIRDKLDIVGAAETGSGKTLAFGIPLLHFIIEQKKRAAERLINDDAEKIMESTDNVTETDGDNEEGDSEGENSDNENGVGDGEENKVDNENSDDDSSEIDDNEGIESECNENDEGEEVEVNIDVGEELMDKDIDDNDEKGESSAEEELEHLEPGATGCVKVIKDVDFSWLEPTVKETVQQPEVRKVRPTYPRALILEPTRELAIQVRNHLQAAAKHTNVTIAAIVGGLAMPKQQRILKKSPDILVATPGRLWELIQQGEVYLSEIEKTHHLVVDEADRMIEKGHFEELEKLLEKMKRDPNRQNRHTYVFSATLSLIHSGPQRMMKKKKKQWNEKQKLAYLMKKMGLKDKPKVVDLTRKVGTVDSLTEARINCTRDEKDIYLYYFLKHYPGRTLVFTNSKDCIRRIVSIFTLLQCNPLPLHADMHQKQRLKNLERFTSNPTSLLMASDVAARGLDIPNVQHVIHYQVPLTVENYVHRSGRTARASKEGLSIMLIGPEDAKNYRKVVHTLNKNEDLPLFPTEPQLMPEIKRRVNMVREIETQEYRFNRSKRKNDWFKKAAEEIGVEIDDQGLLDDLGDGVEQQRHQQYIKQMKQELSVMLKQPLLTSSSYTKYPTMSGKLVTPPAKDEKRNALANVKVKPKVELPEEKTQNLNLTPKQLKKRERRKKLKKRKKKNMS